MSISEIPGFSIVEGGSTHKLIKRLSRRRPEQVFQRTAVFCAAICWLPLMILSVIEGVAWGGDVGIPFFYDIASHARFLIAVPLLVIAESIIGPRLDDVALHFIRSGRVAEEDHGAFIDAIREGARLRDSKWAEAAVVLVAYLSAVAGMMIFAPTISNWAWKITESGVHYTPAAWWYAIVSIPIFQFLFYRWLLRMFIWSRFLYRVSRLKLKLVPTHPDRAGGIAFVGANQRYFGIIAFAFGAVFSGVFGNEVLYESLPLNALRTPAIASAVVIVFLVQMPGYFFLSLLRKTKRRGIFEYGELALEYSTEFEEKWIRGQRPPREELMGSGDIQSLADLGNSYSVIADMKIVPFPFKTSLWLAAAFLVPILPLFLTEMPLEEILETILKLLA